MLLETDIISFYERHQVYPGDLIDLKQYIRLIADANSIGKLFSLFVREALISRDNLFELNFSSWTELTNCYFSFIAGYARSLKN